jgi:hypothetical protein
MARVLTLVANSKMGKMTLSILTAEGYRNWIDSCAETSPPLVKVGWSEFATSVSVGVGPASAVLVGSSLARLRCMETLSLCQTIRHSPQGARAPWGTFVEHQEVEQNGIDASTVQYQIAALEAIVRSLQHLAGSVEQMPLFGEPQRR